MADLRNSNEFFNNLRKSNTPNKKKSMVAPNANGTPNPYMRGGSQLSSKKKSIMAK